MSLLYFGWFVICIIVGKPLESDFFMIWALFSIADALWLKLGRR